MQDSTWGNLLLTYLEAHGDLVSRFIMEIKMETTICYLGFRV